MFIKRLVPLLLFSLMLVGIGCQDSPSKLPSIPAAYVQEFTITGGEETFLTTNSGALLVIPACTFETSTTVKLAFTEAYRIHDFAALSLSTTTENGQLLISAGMFYLNAQDKDGMALTIPNDCAPILRYPVKSILPDAQLYQGTPVNGEIVWKDAAQPLATALTPAPLDDLELYAKRLYQQNQYSSTPVAPKALFTQPNYDYCGIDDSIVGTLYGPHFRQTAIATIEFEERMAVLHEACSEDGLSIYISNLESPLYFSDSLIYELLKPTQPKAAQHFYCFYLQKKTFVPQQQSLSERQLTTWKAFVKQRKHFYDQADSRLFYRIPIDQSNTWYNIDALAAQNIEAYPFNEEVVLSCDDLSPSELQNLSVLCVAQYGNSIRRLHYDKQLNAHVLGGVSNQTTEKTFTLFAYAKKGENVYATSQKITLNPTRTQRHLVLVPATMQEVYDQLANHGLALPQHSLPDGWDAYSHCCKFDYPSEDIGM